MHVHINMLWLFLMNRWIFNIPHDTVIQKHLSLISTNKRSHYNCINKAAFHISLTFHTHCIYLINHIAALGISWAFHTKFNYYIFICNENTWLRTNILMFIFPHNISVFYKIYETYRCHFTCTVYSILWAALIWLDMCV